MLRSLVSLTAAVIFSTLVHADTLPVANTEYSAVRHIESAEATMVQKVNHSFGKERVQTDMGGMSMVMIVRPDKKVAWQIMPTHNMYMEIDMSQAHQMTGKAPDGASIEKVGSEVVEGVETTKYKMLMKDKTAGGFIWLTGDHIPIKMDFLSKSDGEKHRIKMTLKELKIGKQDPALFELPTNVSKMPSAGNFGAGLQ